MLKGVNDSLEDAKLLGENAEGGFGQDQSHSVQSMPGHALRRLRLGSDRKISEYIFNAGVLLAGAHAARPRYPCSLRQLKFGNREIVGARAAGAARDCDDGLRHQLKVVMACPAIHFFTWSRRSKSWMPGTSPGMTVEGFGPMLMDLAAWR